MSAAFPFDIIALIIDIVVENNDMNLLKELALVSHSFHQICIKHLFANVELHDAVPNYHPVSSKKGFLKLVKSRPNVVNYIRKLTYEVSDDREYDDVRDDHLLSPILSNFLPTSSRLNCIAIGALNLYWNWNWNTLDSSLTSAFLHLMRLPTINHIDLSYIRNFPLSSLTSSVNLLRLDIKYLDSDGQDNYLKALQSEMLPKLREFHSSGSYLPTMKLLEAKGQDGRPAFNFMDLRQFSMSYFDYQGDPSRNIQHLLRNAKLLERLRLSVGIGQNLLGIFSTSTRTLKVLDLTVPLYQYRVPPLAGLCEELEAMAGHNTLESLYLEVSVNDHNPVDSIGFEIQKVENILVKPGWSALRQVSFKVQVKRWGESAELCETLQSLPDKYLSHLPKMESVAFSYSAYLA